MYTNSSALPWELGGILDRIISGTYMESQGSYIISLREVKIYSLFSLRSIALNFLGFVHLWATLTTHEIYFRAAHKQRDSQILNQTMNRACRLISAWHRKALGPNDEAFDHRHIT